MLAVGDKVQATSRLGLTRPDNVLTSRSMRYEIFDCAVTMLLRKHKHICLIVQYLTCCLHAHPALHPYATCQAPVRARTFTETSSSLPPHGWTGRARSSGSARLRPKRPCTSERYLTNACMNQSYHCKGTARHDRAPYGPTCCPITRAEWHRVCVHGCCARVC